MFYPTDPWVYNNRPGTEYLAPREQGRKHMGVDAQGPRDSPIYSVLPGYVSGGVWNGSGGYGNTVVIQHENGWSTRYAHFSSAPLVGQGAQVAAGQQIGKMGNTGTGIVDVHLHFEAMKNGSNVHPLEFLSGALAVFNPQEEQLTPAQEAKLDHVINLLAVPGQGYGWPQVNANRIADVQSRLQVPNQGYDFLPAIINQLQAMTDQIAAIQAKVNTL